MFCSKCGKEIDDGAKFCSGCGTSVEQNDLKEFEAVSQQCETASNIENGTHNDITDKNKVTDRSKTEENVIRKKNSFVPFIIIGAAAIIAVLLLIVLITGILVLSSPQRKYDKQLSLGQRYLDELDYEQAIAAYRAAIEIDPKQPDAYAGLANTYIAMEDYESAREVLLEGIDATDSDMLKEMLKELEEKYFTGPETVGTATDADMMSQIPEDALEWNGHYYAIYDDTSSWEEAETLCEDRNGHLATIMSAAENRAISDYVMSMGYYSIYFGCSDENQSGNWVWVTGESLSYTNWHEGEPNQDNEYEKYGMYYFGDGTWNDGDFSGGSYICEWDVGEEDPDLIADFEEEVPEGEFYEIGLIDVPGGYEELFYENGFDCSLLGTIPNILLDASYKCQELYDDAVINETSDAGHWSISTLDEDCFDQTLREIYHLDDEMIESLKTSELPEGERHVSYENGNYVRYEGNVGGDIRTHEYKVISVQFSGTDPGHPDTGRYRFEYEHYAEWPDGEVELYTGYAVMKYKKIEGDWHWTVYEVYEEDGLDSGESYVEDDWKNAYWAMVNDYYDEADLSGMEFTLVYIDNDDIPELITCSEGGARAWMDVHTFYNGLIFRSVACGNDVRYKKKSGLIYAGGASSAEEFGAAILELQHGNITTVMSGYANPSGYYIDGENVGESAYEESFDRYSDIDSDCDWMTYNELESYLSN